MVSYEVMIASLPDDSEFRAWLVNHVEQIRYVIKWFAFTSDGDFIDKLMTEGIDTLTMWADMEKRLAEEDGKL